LNFGKIPLTIVERRTTKKSYVPNTIYFLTEKAYYFIRTMRKRLVVFFLFYANNVFSCVSATPTTMINILTQLSGCHCIINDNVYSCAEQVKN